MKKKQAKKLLCLILVIVMMFSTAGGIELYAKANVDVSIVSDKVVELDFFVPNGIVEDDNREITMRVTGHEYDVTFRTNKSRNIIQPVGGLSPGIEYSYEIISEPIEISILFFSYELFTGLVWGYDRGHGMRGAKANDAYNKDPTAFLLVYPALLPTVGSHALLTGMGFTASASGGTQTDFFGQVLHNKYSKTIEYDFPSTLYTGTFTIPVAPENYTATVSATGHGCQVEASNQDGAPEPFKAGDVITLTASQNENMIGMNWIGATKSDFDPYTATIQLPGTFQENEHYQVTATAQYQIFVSQNVEGQAIKLSQFQAAHGSMQDITIPEVEGYRLVECFDNGLLAAHSGHTFNIGPVDDGHRLEANFVKEYTITASADGYGTVLPSENKLIASESVILTASDSVHGAFSHWTKDGVDIGVGVLTANGSTLQVENPDANAVYTAVFTPKIFNVSINILPGIEAGTVTATPDSGEFGYEGVLEATPYPGYEFSQWKKGDLLIGAINQEIVTVPFDNNMNFEALFTMKDSHFVTSSVFTKNGVGTGNDTTITLDSDTGLEFPANSSSFTTGTELRLSVIDGPEYNFVEWRLEDENGIMVSEDASFTMTVSDKPRHYVAVFEEKYYTVMTSPSHDNRGSTSVTLSSVLATHKTTVKASSKSGYTFKYWMNEAMTSILSYSESYTITPTSNLKVIGVFGKKRVNKPEDEGNDEATEDVNDEVIIDEEEDVPADAPNEGGQESVEILNVDIPLETPDLPQTSGLPARVFFLIGTSLTGLGMKMKRFRK